MTIHEQKQWGSTLPRSASRQYRIYSDNARAAASKARNSEKDVDMQ